MVTVSGGCRWAVWGCLFCRCLFAYPPHLHRQLHPPAALCLRPPTPPTHQPTNPASTHTALPSHTAPAWRWQSRRRAWP